MATTYTYNSPEEFFNDIANFSLGKGSQFVEFDFTPIVPGNIDLFNRPVVKDAAGNIATVQSITISEDNYFVLIPTVLEMPSKKGMIVSHSDAIKHYKRTGKHLGKFSSQAHADTYGKALSKQQGIVYSPSFWYTPKYAQTLEQIRKGEKVQDGVINLSGTTQYYSTLSDFMLAFNVSYSMDSSSQITMEFFDPEYKMAESNFFQIRQEFQYRGMAFEIASVEFGPGPGGSPSVKIEARNAAIQKMKRNKDTTSISGSSGYEYARNVAAKYGLRFLGEQSSNQKNIVHPRSSDKDASVWTVLNQVASENQFVVFEVDGLLVYASQPFLMWRLGVQTRIKTTTSKKKAGSGTTPVKKSTIQRFNKLFFETDLDTVQSSLEYSDQAIDIATAQSTVIANVEATIDLITYYIASRSLSRTSPLAYEYSDGKHIVLIPSITLTGVFEPRIDAIKRYKNSGYHFGKFLAKGAVTASKRASIHLAHINTQYAKLRALGDGLYTSVPAFEVVTYPIFRRSDNDPLEGDGGVVVRKPNGQLLRPGQTAFVGPKPTRMKGGYLITEVLYDELTPDPVQVTFRTPIKPEEQDSPE